MFRIPITAAETLDSMRRDAESIRARMEAEGLRDGRPSPTSGQRLNQERRTASRIRFLSALATGAHSYAQIMIATESCHSTVSNAVSGLVAAGLARSRLRGMKCHVEITDAGVTWLAKNGEDGQ